MCRIGGLDCLRVTDLRAIPDCPDSIGSLLLLSASGNILTIGPLYVPGAGVCLHCVRHWVRTAGWERPAASAPAPGALETLDRIAAEAAAACERGPAGDLLLCLMEIDLHTGQRHKHPIVPRADCPRCSGLRRDRFALSAHCSPLAGIVSSVTVTGEAFAGSYSAIGSYVAPLPVPGARPLIKAQFAMGKGHTKQQAIDSCIGEALERYSLIYTGSERLVRARPGDLPIVDPREILLVSPRQYAMRESWNRTHDDRYWIPEPFDGRSEIDLMAGVDLVSNETVYVPAACCLMWYQFRPGERRFASADTNGCGAGNTPAAATASALLELVERDALAIWWYNRVRRPALLLEDLHSDPLARILDALHRGGRDLYLLDITTDLAIPTYAAISPARDGAEPLFAAAAHPSPSTAALKAASEAAQLIFSAVHTGGLDSELQSWLHTVTLETHAYLAPLGRISAPPEPEPLSDAQIVTFCVERIAAAGLRAIAVDQSRPDVLLKTVRAVVPGLRHIWARFAPGRLYETPARLGWLSAPLNEEGLNSILCMI